ncbi:MAG: magnesium transporter [Clostridia bacterium]|nr:magnesium transporter [Clostridia bacterium]
MEENKELELFENQLEERLNELLQIVQANYHAQKLRDMITDYHANDVAQILPLLEKQQRARLYNVLSNEDLSDIFSYLDDPAPFVEEMSSEKAADIIEEMDSGDAVDLLEELNEEKKQELIELLDEEAAQDVALISGYEEDEIGSIMTTDFIVIRQNFTIKQAMNSLIAQAADNQNISTIYVADENEVYLGAIPLRDLFVARASDKLEDVIITSYPYLNATDKTSEVLEKIKDYAEDSLPVLDANNRLIGALTGNSAVEIVEEEMVEDYVKLAAVSESEVTEENIPLIKNVLTRLPWLIILLGLGLAVSAIIGTFDFVIAIIPLAAFFQPMALGMSGNAGTQSLAVTIRAIAENDKKAIKTRMVKEVAISFFNGLILALISFIIVGVYLLLFKNVALGEAFSLSGCISLALIVAITISGLNGCLIPMIFKKLGVDPAAASGPLISTTSDLVSAVTYYGLCALLLL